MRAWARAGTFQDVARGADYVRALARRFPLDLSRVILVGHSAGGQLALWLAARRNLPRRSPLFSADPIRVRGVVSLTEHDDPLPDVNGHIRHGPT